MTTVRLGTRGSALAVTQSRWVADLLEAHAHKEGLDLTVELVEITTRGDTDPTALAALGGVGVFAAALRTALLAGECDLAVHSYKDLPTAPTPGLMIAAVPKREDPRDALCVRGVMAGEEDFTPAQRPDGSLHGFLPMLPHGARVGTGSPRRSAQLLAQRDDLEIVPIRGNVPTRLARVVGSVVSADGPMGATREPDLDAVILAHAGLKRLGLQKYASDVLGPVLMLPAAAQGALAVETREDVRKTHPELAVALACLNDPLTRACADAERAMMRELGAGCAAPVGALAVPFSTANPYRIPQAWLGSRATRSSVSPSKQDALDLGIEIPERKRPTAWQMRPRDEWPSDKAPTICLTAGVTALDGHEARFIAAYGSADEPEKVGIDAAHQLIDADVEELADIHATKDGHAHPAPGAERA